MDTEWIDKINGTLTDVLPKNIFSLRVMYYLTKDRTYIDFLGNLFRDKVINDMRWKSFVEKLKAAAGRNGLVLYGAGAFGEKIVHNTCDINWRCVIDASPKKESFMGFDLIDVNKYFNDIRNGETVVITSKRYFEEMTRVLVEHNVTPEEIIDGTILYDLTEGSQYFDLEAMKPGKGKEFFVDAGCFDGMSSVEFMRWCDGNGFCYCFEPDSSNQERIINNMRDKGFKKGEKYRLIHKGLWYKEDILSFVASATGASHVASVYGGAEDTSSQIDVTAIDTVLLDEKVTFIKMDIEGSELKALQGARRVITEQRPRLAICVYHKPEDIKEIPEYILKLRPDYKLFFRHYSFSDAETVLYAV